MEIYYLTGKMGTEPIRPVKRSVSIDTMINLTDTETETDIVSVNRPSVAFSVQWRTPRLESPTLKTPTELKKIWTAGVLPLQLREKGSFTVIKSLINK